MPREHPVRTAGDFLQKGRGRRAGLGEVQEQGAAHRGARVVEETQEGVTLSFMANLGFHGPRRKKNCAARNRETRGSEK